MIDRNLRKLIVWHYRRAGFDPHLREFQVLLERDSVRRRVGEYCLIEGTYHKPREIFKLIEEGWRAIAVMSCFRWYWTARVWNDWEREWEEATGRGWSEVIDIIEGERWRRYRMKWIMIDLEEKILSGWIPDELEDMFEKTPWLEAE